MNIPPLFLTHVRGMGDLNSHVSHSCSPHYTTAQRPCAILVDMSAIPTDVVEVKYGHLWGGRLEIPR